MFFHAQTMKKISALAGPIALVRILYVLTNVVGMILISRLGKNQFAAGAIITALLNTIMVIAMSFTISTSIIASRYFGSGDYEKIGQLLRSSFAVTFVISVIVMLILSNIELILTLFKQPTLLFPYISGYLKVIAWSIPASLFMANLHQLCFSVHKQKLVFILSIASPLLTISLGIFLLYGKYSFPEIGMNGWAYAIVISNWILLIVALTYIAYDKHFIPFKLFTLNNKPICKKQLNSIKRIGIPITFQISGELIVFALMNLMVGWVSVTALTVQQIILQCTVLSLMIPMGIGQGGAILIGQSIGKKDFNVIPNICKSGEVLALACMILVCIFYVFFPELIISLFTSLKTAHSHFISLTKTVLLVAAASQIADTLRNVQLGYLRGLHDIWTPMTLNLGMLILSLPIAYFLAFTLHMGLIGINLAYMTAFILGAFWMYVRIKQKLKELIQR